VTLYGGISIFDYGISSSALALKIFRKSGIGSGTFLSSSCVVH